MKKVLLTIIAIAATASISSTAHAKGSEFWSFMNTFFSGKGLDPECTVVNSQNGLYDSAVVQAMDGKKVSVTYDDKGNASISVK